MTLIDNTTFIDVLGQKGSIIYLGVFPGKEQLLEVSYVIQ